MLATPLVASLYIAGQLLLSHDVHVIQVDMLYIIVNLISSICSKVH